jgi:hypothetical protein
LHHCIIASLHHCIIASLHTPYQLLLQCMQRVQRCNEAIFGWTNNVLPRI